LRAALLKSWDRIDSGAATMRLIGAATKYFLPISKESSTSLSGLESRSARPEGWLVGWLAAWGVSLALISLELVTPALYCSLLLGNKRLGNLRVPRERARPDGAPAEVASKRKREPPPHQLLLHPPRTAMGGTGDRGLGCSIGATKASKRLKAQSATQKANGHGAWRVAHGTGALTGL
jgi:hypothetical protein